MSSHLSGTLQKENGDTNQCRFLPLCGRKCKDPVVHEDQGTFDTYMFCLFMKQLKGQTWSKVKMEQV